MFTVKTLPEFDTWLDGLKDRMMSTDIAKAKQRETMLED